MFYKLNKNNEIIEVCVKNYDGNFLWSDKNIIESFDGRLVFEEETQTEEYISKKSVFEAKLVQQQQSLEKINRMEELRKDFEQERLGFIFDDMEQRKSEYIRLLNEVRVLQGKKPRQLKTIEKN